MTTPNEPNKARTIPLHIADQAVTACEAEIQKLKEENAQLKHKLGRLLGAQQEWTLVEPEHYARLKAEVERLTQFNDTLALRYDATKSMLDGCAKEIEEMEAEVERLRKAGDALEQEVIGCYFEQDDPADSESLRAWRAAKEGKPSV
jgi:chromosome segregation ATPase